MSDISKINPNGTEYNLKDATARAGIESSKTLKSSVVTVTDAAPINAEDITVDITPIQDLHGYDRPWAGGAGKNKLPMTVAGIKAANTYGTWSGNSYTVNGATFTINTDNAGNVISITSNNGGDAQIRLIFTLSAGIYTMSSGFTEQQGLNDTFLTKGITVIARGNSGSPGQTFTLSESTELSWYFRVSRTAVVCTPMIRLASETDPTFAPYSNICPIEGWTGAELDRLGKNLCPIEKLGSTGSQHFNLPPGSYSFSFNLLGTPKYSTSKIKLQDSNDNVIAQISVYNQQSYVTQFELSEITEVYINPENINMDSSGYCADSIQLELGATPTTYEPYQGQQYTASFGETVYGGKWHVTEGGTDKTHANIASYNGETINEPWLSSMDEYSPGATPTTGAQVVYPLTAPTTISTPKQNVPMLQGINTVYANCGDVSLKYQPDNVIGELKGEIEDNIIYEDYKWTTESSRSYSAGTPGTYGCSSWRNVAKEGYDVIGVTFVENRRFGDCILTLHYIPSTSRVEVIIFRATSSSVTIADEDIEYRVAYKKRP